MMGRLETRQAEDEVKRDQGVASSAQKLEDLAMNQSAFQQDLQRQKDWQDFARTQRCKKFQRPEHNQLKTIDSKCRFQATGNVSYTLTGTLGNAGFAIYIYLYS